MSELSTVVSPSDGALRVAKSDAPEPSWLFEIVCSVSFVMLYVYPVSVSCSFYFDPSRYTTNGQQPTVNDKRCISGHGQIDRMGDT